MAGILVLYARFVEVQQRRARVVAQLMQLLQHEPEEANGVAAVEDHPGELGESRPPIGSTPDDAAAQRTRDGKRGVCTTRGSVDG